MSIIEQVQVKWDQWNNTFPGDIPDTICFPPDKYGEFLHYIDRVERNEVPAPYWIKSCLVLSSKGISEIRVGILI